MLVDSHAHLNFAAFEDKLEAVINRCQEREMKVINIGTQEKTALAAIALAREYKDFYAAIGLHPLQEEADQKIAFGRSEAKIFAAIADLVKEKKVVAIGETGFDFSRVAANDLVLARERQKELLLRHWQLAWENKLPIIFHCRGAAGDPLAAYLDLLEIIDEQFALKKSIIGVIHCFNADWKIAQEFIKRGFLIGVTGIVTFNKKAEELQAIVKGIPLTKILIETDSPYLAPEPHRGETNEPIYVEYVAAKIAKLKNLDYFEVENQTAQNAIDLFGLI